MTKVGRLTHVDRETCANWNSPMFLLKFSSGLRHLISSTCVHVHAHFGSKMFLSRSRHLRSRPAPASHQHPRQQQPIHLLVDVDTGIDDAWALFLLLRAHQNPDVDLTIEAITTVHGNTTVDNVLVNTTRVLNTAGVTGIPVYRGSESAMTIEFVEEPPYHGEDGFGDADLPPIEPIVEPGHAVGIIIQKATEFKGTLTVLALGPLTNLALAINQAPEIADYFAELVILGANYEGHGNVTPSAEFNVMSDVEAARTVLDRYTCPMTVVPNEMWIRHATSTYEFRVEDLGMMDTPQILLMNQVEAKHFENNKETWNVADAVAAAIVMEPLLTTKTESHYCTVELNGTFTRGMMVIDREGFIEKPPNVKIVTEVDTELYEKMLRTAAGGPYYET